MNIIDVVKKIYQTTGFVRIIYHGILVMILVYDAYAFFSFINYVVFSNSFSFMIMMNFLFYIGIVITSVLYVKSMPPKKENRIKSLIYFTAVIVCSFLTWIIYALLINNELHERNKITLILINTIIIIGLYIPLLLTYLSSSEIKNYYEGTHLPRNRINGNNIWYYFLSLLFLGLTIFLCMIVAYGEGGWVFILLSVCSAFISTSSYYKIISLKDYKGKISKLSILVFIINLPFIFLALSSLGYYMNLGGSDISYLLVGLFFLVIALLLFFVQMWLENRAKRKL